MTAALETDGERVVASGVRDLEAGQVKLLQPDEVAAKLKGEHAEVTALAHARENNLQPKRLAASRPICDECAEEIRASGGTLTSDRTAIWE